MPPACPYSYDDASCKRWSFSNSLESHLPSRVDNETTVLKGGLAPSKADFSTIVLFASCMADDDYNEHMLVSNLHLLRENVVKPLIITATCRRLSNRVNELSDYVVLDLCAAKRGYDAGLWQRAYLFAVAEGLWRYAAYAILLNDSVLGPLGPLRPSHTGVTFGAVWAQHVGSAAVVMYGRDVIHSPTFTTYWRDSTFFCGKWGSMYFHEGRLAILYRSFRCSTYTNDIHQFSKPAVMQLPFHKHKNPPHDLRSQWERTRTLPNITTLTTTRTMAIMPCATMPGTETKHDLP